MKKYKFEIGCVVFLLLTVLLTQLDINRFVFFAGFLFDFLINIRAFG